MRENEITFAEFRSIVENTSKFDVEVVPTTSSPWDCKRVESFILNQENSGHSELRYYREPFVFPVFNMKVELKDKIVFLFKVAT